MANAIFNAKITLTSSSATVNADEFNIVGAVVDNEGLYSGIDPVVGDILILDTAGTEPGTVSKYKILSFTSQTFGAISAKIKYDDIGTAIDPTGAVGIGGMICSASASSKFPWLPAIDTQGLSVKLFIFAKNILERQKIDGNLSGGGGSSNQKIMIGGSALAAGVPVSKNPATGKVILADSDGVGTQQFYGVTITTCAGDGSPVTVQLPGANLAGVLTGLGFAVGDEIFMGETAGSYVNGAGVDAFVGANDSIFKLGIADCAASAASATAVDLILLPEVVARP